MNSELGREMTSAERMAVALGQTTIMDILHGVALELNEAYREEVAMVMPSGTVITRGELEDEIRSTLVNSRSLRPAPSRSLILGVNASVNMFS